MKNLFLSLAFMLIGSFAFANNVDSTFSGNDLTSFSKDDNTIVSIKYTIGSDSFEIKKSFTTNDSELLNFIDSELLKIDGLINSSFVTGDICSVTISVGSGSTYISGTITGDCEGIGERAAAYKKKLMALL